MIIAPGDNRWASVFKASTLTMIWFQPSAPRCETHCVQGMSVDLRVESQYLECG